MVERIAMSARFVLLFCLSLCNVAHAEARVKLNLQCVSFGDGPALECIVQLQTAKDAPLSGAMVTLNAHMPAMPMAHGVKPSAAIATNQPGEYRGQLHLEMPGVWAIQVDVSSPKRDRLVRRLLVEPCEKDKRCVAKATTSKPGNP